MQRARRPPERADVERLAEQRVARRVGGEGDRVVVREERARHPQRVARRLRHDLLGAGIERNEPRDLALELRVELRREGRGAPRIDEAAGRGERRRLRMRVGRQRLLGQRGERGVELRDLGQHRLDDQPRLRWDVGLRRHPRVAQQRQSGDRVVEPRPRGDRQHVARRLLRAPADVDPPLLGPAPAGGEEGEEPLRGRRGERGGQRVVRLLHPPERPLVDLLRLAPQLRHGGRAAPDLHVALADLLRVVEGVGVEEAPHGVARNAVERELEVGVLEDRVVAGAVQLAGQLVALAPSLVARLAFEPVAADLLGRDEPLRRVAAARRGDGLVDRPRERRDETNLWLDAETEHRCAARLRTTGDRRVAGLPRNGARRLELLARSVGRRGRVAGRTADGDRQRRRAPRGEAAGEDADAPEPLVRQLGRGFVRRAARRAVLVHEDDQLRRLRQLVRAAGELRFGKVDRPRKMTGEERLLRAQIEDPGAAAGNLRVGEVALDEPEDRFRGDRSDHPFASRTALISSGTSSATSPTMP